MVNGGADLNVKSKDGTQDIPSLLPALLSESALFWCRAFALFEVL